MRRRDLLGAIPALGAGCAGAARIPPGGPPDGPPDGEGLHARAARRGLFFGAAVDTPHLADPRLVAAFARECGLLVPERAAKWDSMEREPGRPDFSVVDASGAFATRHGAMFRGHTLLWYRRVPGWANPLGPAAFRDAAARRIARDAARYAGRMHSWDVVNEAIRVEDGRADGMRESQILSALGPDFVAWACERAREADPHALLTYNDYAIEQADDVHRRKRAAVLRLLERTLRAGAPLGVLGVQAHLYARLRFDAGEWRRFLREVAGMGLRVIVTELDVQDEALPGEVAARDAAVASLTRGFLDATLDEPATLGVIAWGLADHLSWLNAGGSPRGPRADGLPRRPLPLDADYARKPMWSAIAAALDAAPQR